MNKYKKVLILTLIFVFSFGVPIASASLMGALIPMDADEKAVWKYAPDNYSIDTYIEESGFSDWMPWNIGDTVSAEFYASLATFLEGLWGLNILASAFAISWIGEAFSFDIVDSMINQVDTIIKKLSGINGNAAFTGTGIWPWAATALLTLTGISSIFLMARGKTTAVFNKVAGTAIAFVLSVGFIANAGFFLGGLNEDIKDVQEGLLDVSVSLSTGSSYKETEGIVTIKKQLHEILIYKPYLLLQYGSTDEAEIESKDNESGSRIKRLLKERPYTKDRAEVVKDEGTDLKNETMQPRSTTLRLATAAILLVVNGVLSLFLGLICVGIFLAQLAFVFAALASPAILIFSLIPRYQRTVVSFLAKLVLYQLKKLGYTLLLTLMFTTSTVLYAATDELGYLTMMSFQILCFFGIFALRKKILGLTVTPVKNAGKLTVSPGLRAYKDKFTQTKSTINKVSSTINGFASKSPYKGSTGPVGLTRTETAATSKPSIYDYKANNNNQVNANKNENKNVNPNTNKKPVYLADAAKNNKVTDLNNFKNSKPVEPAEKQSFPDQRKQRVVAAGQARQRMIERKTSRGGNDE